METIKVPKIAFQIIMIFTAIGVGEVMELIHRTIKILRRK